MPPETHQQPLPFADEPIEVSESEGIEQADDGDVIFIENLPDLLGKDEAWFRSDKGPFPVIGARPIDASDHRFLREILRIARVFRFRGGP